MEQKKAVKKSGIIPFRRFGANALDRHKTLFAGITNPMSGVSKYGNAAAFQPIKGGVGVRAKISF